MGCTGLYKGQSHHYDSWLFNASIHWVWWLTVQLITNAEADYCLPFLDVRQNIDVYHSF